MTLFDTTVYVKDNGVSGWTAVPSWAALTAYTAGQFVRQAAAVTAGNERVMVCIVAGTSLAAEPSWVITRGAKTAEAAGPTWQEATGQAALNGSPAETVTWTTVKGLAVTLGQIIKNVSGGADTYFICTTAGTAGSGTEPTWNKTAGATTTDNTVTWTSIGAISNFSAIWAAPHARLTAALAATWTLGGTNVWVSNNHAETQASALTWPQGPNNVSTIPNSIVCVSDLAAPPTARATTASISTTGASSINTSSFIGGYFYGLNFNAGSAANSSTLTTGNTACIFEACNFNLNNTNAGSSIQPASGNSTADVCQYINCNFVFGATGQTFLNGNSGAGAFYNCTFAKTGSVPTVFARGTAFNNRSYNLLFRDCDFSQITGTLFTCPSPAALVNGDTLLENCSLGSGVTLVNFSTPVNFPYMPRFRFHNCDSANTNYRYYYTNKLGVVQQETTIIRSGGASDGTTGVSWNVATNGAGTASFNTPFYTEEIAQWDTLSGAAQTATIFLTSNTALDNSMVWMELEYPGNSSNPLGSITTTKMPLFGTPTALASDSSVWGGSISNKYSIPISFTPQMKGVVKARLFVAAQNITLYLDPLVVVSGQTSQRQYLIPGYGYVNESPNSGGSGASMLVHPGMSGGARG